MASQTRLALLRQHSGLSDEEELHGTFYCTHTQPRFGATFLQGWLYVFDSVLIFDANLLAVNRLQCIIPLKDVRVIRKRTLLRINNTIAVEWEDAEGAPHYDIFTSFMFGSRSRAFDTMVEQWRRAGPAVSSPRKSLTSREWRNSITNQHDNPQQTPEHDATSPKTLLAAGRSPFFVSALRSSMQRQHGQQDAAPDLPDFPIWPPLVTAEEQPAKVETESGVVMYRSTEDVKQLEPLELQGISVQKFAQVLLSDKSGFLPAAHSAQGDVLQDNSQGLTCWQVIPGGQPHAGGLVRHMRYFHTTADNYRAHVTQQQVLMMTPAGSLVVQIKQSLQVLNKLSLDVGKHCCTLIRWEVSPTGNSTTPQQDAGSATEVTTPAAPSSSPFASKQHQQQKHAAGIDSAPPSSTATSHGRHSSRSLAHVRRRNSAPVIDTLNNSNINNASDSEHSSTSVGADAAASSTVRNRSGMRRSKTATAAASASPSGPATPSRTSTTSTEGTSWLVEPWHISNRIQRGRHSSPTSDDNSSSSDSSSGGRSSASNASQVPAPGSADSHRSAAVASNAAGGASADEGCVWRVQVQLAGTNSALFNFVKHRSLTASVKTYESVMADGKGWLLHEGVRQTAGQLVPHAEAAVAEAQAAVIAAAAAGIPDVNQHGGQHSRNSSWASAMSPTAGSYEEFVQEQQLVPTLNSNLSINLQLQQRQTTKSATSRSWWPVRMVVGFMHTVLVSVVSFFTGIVRQGQHSHTKSVRSSTASLASPRPPAVPVSSAPTATVATPSSRWTPARSWSPYAVAVLLGLQLVSTAVIMMALWRVVVLQEKIVQIMTEQYAR